MSTRQGNAKGAPEDTRPAHRPVNGGVVVTSDNWLKASCACGWETRNSSFSEVDRVRQLLSNHIERGNRADS